MGTSAPEIRMGGALKSAKHVATADATISAPIPSVPHPSSTVASRPVDDLDAFLDHLLDEAVADTDDDTCLIGIQPM